MGARSHSYNNINLDGRSRLLPSDHKQPSSATKDQEQKCHRRHRGRHHSSLIGHPRHSSSSAPHSQTQHPQPTPSRNPSAATPVPLLPHPPHIPPIPHVPQSSSSFNSPLSPSPSALPRPSITSTTFADAATASPSFTSLSSSASFTTAFVSLITSGSSASGSSASITEDSVPGFPTNSSKISGSSSLTNLGIVLGIVVGGLALMGLVAVFWFRYLDRQRNRKDLMLQQDYPSQGLWGGDSENGMAATMGSGNTIDVTGTNGAGAIASIGTVMARPSYPQMTSFRHETFMALVKEAALGFYAPSLDHLPAAAGSLSAEGPVVSTNTVIARGGEVKEEEEEEEEESKRGQEGGSQGPSDNSSEGELEYLDAGSLRPPAVHRIPH